MATDKSDFIFRGEKPIVLSKWKVKAGNRLSQGTVLLLYETNWEGEKQDTAKQMKLKSTVEGTVYQLIAHEGDIIRPGCVLLRLIQVCTHPTVMKDMCAECGADLRELDNDNLNKVASVSMIHSVPELRVSHEEAQQLGQADEYHLLKAKKLVLLVDLDQTLIHTTNDSIPLNLKDVYHFQLYGPQTPWYHTRLRPGMRKFLDAVSKLYELHICTFGARPYAHKIANLLDPQGNYFSHRILSRDECFNPNSKTGNLKALFPCGDSMVCIIDDREDVWNFAPNLVPVKPYHFFSNTGDINAPPEMNKTGENGHSFQSSNVKKTKDKTDNEEKPSVQITDSPSTLEKDSPMELGIDTDKPGKDNSTADSIESASVNSGELECENSHFPGDSELPNDKNYEVSSTDEISTLANDSLKNNDQIPDTSNAVKKLEDDVDIASEIDDSDDDDYLLYLEEILITIHKAYYDMYDQMKAQNKDTIPDLKNVIPYVKRKVLKGINIVFSGVIPTNMSPERSKLWIVAKSLGANVTSDIVPHDNSGLATTHVIAAKWGTFKVNKARKIKSVFIITPEWLWCCAERWEHVDEKLFLLSRDTVVQRHLYQTNAIRDSRDSRQDGKDNNKSSTSENVCSVYDPVTGKKIRKNAKETVKKNNGKYSQALLDCATSRSDEKFSNSYSPLLYFSTQDIKDMGTEVDDACNEESEDKLNSGNRDSDDSDSESALHTTDQKETEDRYSDSSVESLTGGECPRGWKKRKREDMKKDSTKFGGVIDSESEGEEFMKYPRRELPRDSDKSSEDKSDSDDYNESIGSVDEEMAAAVEREFLSS